MNKFFKFIGIFFLTLGILAIGIGVYFKIDIESFKKNAVETEATITHIDSKRHSDGDTSYVVKVSFLVDGQEYGGDLNYYSSSMYVGKKEKIYYDSSNPNHFKSGDDSFVTWIFILVGTIASVVGGGCLIYIIRKNKKKDKLLAYNYVIHANIVGFNLDTSVSINGRNPYRMEATYINPADGKLYTYKSDALWADLSPVLAQRQITTIPVYVNPNNFSEYYVDIRELQNYIGN